MKYHRLNSRFWSGTVAVRITGWSTRASNGRPCSYRGKVTLPSGASWAFDDLALGCHQYDHSVDARPMLRKVAEAALGWASASLEETGCEGQPPQAFVNEFETVVDADHGECETTYRVR